MKSKFLSEEEARELLLRCTFKIPIEPVTEKEARELCIESDDKNKHWWWGTGFFISEDYALTAFHNLPKEVRLGESSTLTAYYKEHNIQFDCLVASSLAEPEGDIAVLKLRKGRLIDVEFISAGYLDVPASFVRSEQQRQRRQFWKHRKMLIYGFPREEVERFEGQVGRSIDGEIDEWEPFVPADTTRGPYIVGEAEWLNFHAQKKEQAELLKGISGAPMLDYETGCVLGVEHSYVPERNTVYGTELALLLKKWPKLAEFATKLRAGPPDYCKSELAKSLANCLRCQAMRKFAYLFLRLDQLPSGGWSRSLADWMDEIWAGDDTVQRDSLIPIEGGIESTTFLCDLYLRFCDLYGLKPDERVLEQVERYLEARQIGGGFGTKTIRQEGIRVHTTPRHTTYSVFTLLQLKEKMPRVPNSHINRSFQDYLFVRPRNELLGDSNPYPLALILARLAWELVNQPNKHALYKDSNPEFRDRIGPSLEDWLKGISNSQGRERIHVGLHELFDVVFEKASQDRSPIAYEGFPAYAGFRRMNYYTTLSGLRFACPAVPKAFLSQMANWLEKIFEKLLKQAPYGMLAKEGLPFWSEREPTIQGPRGDVGMTALMLDVLSDEEALSLILQQRKPQAGKAVLSTEGIGRVKQELFSFLLEHFDDYLDPHRPEIFRYTYGGTYCRILALPPCRYPEQEHGLPPLKMQDFIDSVDEFVKSEISEKSIFDFLRKHLVGRSLPVPAIRVLSLTRLLVDRIKPGRYAKPPSSDEETRRRVEQTIAVYRSQEFAERFDQCFGNTPRIEIADPFLAMLEKKKQLKILDVGGGPGQYAHYFLKESPNSFVYYLDASEAMKRCAEAKLGAFGARVTFVTGNLLDKDVVRKLQKEARTGFDGIWCSAVLVHFPRRLVPTALKTLHTLLAEDGVLFVNFQAGNVALVSRDGRYFEYYDDIAALKLLLENAGFDIAQVVTRYETKNLYGEPKLVLAWHNFYCRKPRQQFKVDSNWVDECNRVAYDVYTGSYCSKWGKQLSEQSKNLADWFLAESGLQEGGHILDVGCGPGQFARYFYDKGYRVTALDVSPEMIKLAKEMNGNRSITYVQEDMRRTSFSNGSFDAVFSCASFLHVLPQDVPATLREWRRILKPKGILFVSVQIERQSRLEWDNRYMVFYENEQAVRTAIENSGFQVVKTSRNESVDNTHGFPIKLIWINCLAQPRSV